MIRRRSAAVRVDWGGLCNIFSLWTWLVARWSPLKPAEALKPHWKTLHWDASENTTHAIPILWSSCEHHVNIMWSYKYDLRQTQRSNCGEVCQAESHLRVSSRWDMTHQEKMERLFSIFSNDLYSKSYSLSRSICQLVLGNLGQVNVILGSTSPKTLVLLCAAVCFDPLTLARECKDAFGVFNGQKSGDFTKSNKRTRKP